MISQNRQSFSMSSILKRLSIFSGSRGPAGPDLPSQLGRKFQFSVQLTTCLMALMLTLKQTDEYKARVDWLHLILGQTSTGSYLRLRTYPGLVLDRSLTAYMSRFASCLD